MSQTRSLRRAAERRALKLARKQSRINLPEQAVAVSVETTDSVDQRASKILATSHPTLSPEKLAANRANAQQSTGPKTPEGKAASSQNNFKHGLYSKQLVLPCENAAELDALKFDLHAEHQPANITESILVNEMAESYWRLKRARRFEAVYLSAPDANANINGAHRMMATAERGFHKALKTLRELQKQRGFVPPSVQINVSPEANTEIRCVATCAAGGGFESQNEPNQAEPPTQSQPQQVDIAAVFTRRLADPATEPLTRFYMEEFLRSRAEEDSIKAELAEMGYPR